ncbi:MAG: hypothetical protein QM734_03145 [Cyclobacteriaceae bacterium]
MIGALISVQTFLSDADELTKILPTYKQTTTYQDGIISTGTNLMAISTGVNFYSTGSTAFDFIGAQPSTNIAAQENSTPNSTHDFTTYINVVHLSTGNTLQLKVTGSASIGFLSGSAYPFFQFRLQAPNGVITDDPLGQRLMHSSGDTWTSGNFTISTTGKYKIIYRVIPQVGTNYLSWSLFFQNFQANAFYSSSAVKDKLIVTKNLTTSNPLGLKETTLYYSDGETQDNYGALLASTVTGYTQTSIWSSYQGASAKGKFDNPKFTGGTFQWFQMANPALGNQGGFGAGINWSYVSSSGWATASNGGSGDYFTKVLYQSGFTSGLYSINLSVQNESAIVSVNPNIDFGIWISSGGTMVRLNTQVYNLTSTVGFGSKLFIFNVPVNNANIGFDMYRFGPGTDVKVWINGATINSYTSNELNQTHYYLYNVSKIKKRYKFTDFVTLSTYPNQTVSFNSIITINGTNYEITGYSYDIVNNKLDLQLAEFIDAGLLSISNTFSNLTTINGQ